MLLIAGPCVIEENYDNLLRTIEYILESIEGKDINFYFKASCVKDNRTTIDNYRGVGFDKGSYYMQRIKREFNVKITTDFHDVDRMFEYGNIFDLIQIPAYLAQQTSLLRAAAKMNMDIHIKKPQFLGPVEFNKIIQKARDLNYFDKKIIGTDRGTLLGYNQTFVDPRHFGMIDADKVLADITHPNKNYPGSVQSKIEALGMAAIAAGADGIFAETAINCDSALCDSATMARPEIFIKLIDKLYKLWRFNEGLLQ